MNNSTDMNAPRLESARHPLPVSVCSSSYFPVKSVEELQQAALQEYGPDLHMALRSRRDELLYLRTLTETLFPFVMPPKATDCRCVKPCRAGC